MVVHKESCTKLKMHGVIQLLGAESERPENYLMHNEDCIQQYTCAYLKNAPINGCRS